MPVQVGSPAPPFNATAYHADKDEFADTSLVNHRDSWLCLFFFPAAFSPLCPTEITGFNESAAEFQKRGCKLLGCSTDQQFALKGWCQSNLDLAKLTYPLLADATKRITMDYGLLLPDKGLALRGTFLIDPTSTIRWMAVYDLPIGRSSDEILRTLDALQTGGLCPFNWNNHDSNTATK